MESPGFEDINIEDINIGDRVAIYTGRSGHRDHEFGIVVRKTKRTVDIDLVNQKRPAPARNMYGEITPIWSSFRDNVKAWSSKDGGVWYQKEDLVYLFDDTYTYKMSS